MPTTTHGVARAGLSTALFVFAFLLAGCGGGGGGSTGETPAGNSPPTAPPLTAPAALVITPTAVTASVVEGMEGTLTAALTLAAHVDLPGPIIYVDIEHDDTILRTVTLVGTGPSAASVALFSSEQLAIGEYSGSVDFYVCRTQSCEERYSPTPAKLAYRITITPAPPAGVVTPTSVTKTVESGDPFEIPVTLDLDPNLAIGSLELAVDDEQGLFFGSPRWEHVAGRQYSVSLIGQLAGNPGTYTGTLNLLICRGLGCTRRTDVVGSPLRIPYTIIVTPVPSLAPIPTITGLPEWETHQGNAAHTGYVPVTLDKSKFTSGWSWTSPFASTRLHPVTTGSGLAVVSVAGGNSPAYLVAVNEGDGTIAWQHSFGSIGYANHPAASAGRVFVATTGPAAMWSFDLATGRQLFRTPFESQSNRYLAPVFKNGVVYANGGTFGGLYAFKGSSGLIRWFRGLAQTDLWSPAVDDTHVYAPMGYEWNAVNRETGELAFTVRNSTYNSNGQLNTAPVIDTPDTIVLVDTIGEYPPPAHRPNQLVRYRISTRSELWRVAGAFATVPATAGGRIYVADAATSQLAVYDATTGTKLWFWSAPEQIPVGNLLLTNNLVFVRASAATYAIDLATHQSVWSTQRTGHLALSSNGVLYIVGPQRIDTVDLL